MQRGRLSFTLLAAFRKLSTPLTKSGSANPVGSAESAGKSAMAMGRSGAAQNDLMAKWPEMPQSPARVLRSLAGPALGRRYANRTTNGAPSLPSGRYFGCT